MGKIEDYLENMWFQQDGATSYTTQTNRKIIETTSKELRPAKGPVGGHLCFPYDGKVQSLF